MDVCTQNDITEVEGFTGGGGKRNEGERRKSGKRKREGERSGGR